MSIDRMSEFARKLEPAGRILESPDYQVWCCSPIYGPDGKVHVFFSRWKNHYDHLGWVAACEVAHAVAERPEGPYEVVGVALSGRGDNAWDSWSIHNPTVYQVDGRYILLYMGSDGSSLGVSQDELMAMKREEYLPYFHKLVSSKRVGMAIADSLYGPWARVGDKPIVDIGETPSWDDFCTSNPAFTVTPEGKYRIYYKAWDQRTAVKFNGNRKYGFAESDKLEGPYVKYQGNPVIDLSGFGERMQVEDAYMWHENGKYNAIMRDMGFNNHEYGLFMQSEDGIKWNTETPMISYLNAAHYFDEPLIGLEREGRFERPQLLMRDGIPEYLFAAYVGGKYNTSSGVVLKLK
ncbi:glycoside hydrolase family protein [Cohnella suwonensis]|uniref:Glycoside hydrolase family protein n=1 Tax=Cohnella suwonensis TaxID=696072 RepID=A0ABW0LR95_9BACL